MLRIAILHFPVNDVGGIDSWVINIQKGFRRLGHEPQLIHSTAQSRFKCHPTEGRTTSRKTILPGIHLGYRFNELDKTLAKLNEYDLVIYLHPAPHPTADNLKREDIDNWRDLYTKVTKPKLQIHHDAKWDTTNDWIIDVVDHVDAVLAAQHHFLPAVERYVEHRAIDPSTSIKTWWEYFPLDVPKGNIELLLPRKEPFGIVATQWIQWKNHRKFLPMLPQIETPIRFFGAGIEYHYAVREGEFDKYIGTDVKEHIVYNEDNPHRYIGFVPYQEVLTAMELATFSIDLSTRGYTNMTHWEPLMYGTANMMAREVFDDEFNEVPRDCLWIYDFDELPKHIIEVMNSNTMRRVTARRGFEFVSDVCDCEKVAARILHRMELD